MSNYKCKCGCTDMFVKNNGNQIGLYCKSCGKWQKWLNKNEFRAFENNMEEIWKDIEGYEGLYQVSNFGKIKSIGYKKKKILKPTQDHYGYLNVTLYKNKNKKAKRIHRLVAEAFIANPENKPEIDHIDTDKLNNNVKNLRWVTRIENNNNELTLKHKSDLFTGKNNPFYGKHHTEITKRKLSEAKKGSLHSNETKLKMSKSHMKIKVYCIELNKVFNSIKEAGEILNLDQSSISKVCKEKLKTTGGYHFKYVKE